jgi:hypothetical protein
VWTPAGTGDADGRDELLRGLRTCAGDGLSFESEREVYRQHHVQNNPVNLVDPAGKLYMAAAAPVAEYAAMFPPYGDILAGAIIAGAGALDLYSYWNEKVNEGTDVAQPDPAAPIPDNPSDSPGEDWVWKGGGPPESGKGNWVNDKTGQRLHPDLCHPAPKGPHWGLTNPDGSKWDYFPGEGWKPGQ